MMIDHTGTGVFFPCFGDTVRFPAPHTWNFGPAEKLRCAKDRVQRLERDLGAAKRDLEILKRR